MGSYHESYIFGSWLALLALSPKALYTGSCLCKGAKEIFLEGSAVHAHQAAKSVF